MPLLYTIRKIFGGRILTEDAVSSYMIEFKIKGEGNSRKIPLSTKELIKYSPVSAWEGAKKWVEANYTEAKLIAVTGLTNDAEDPSEGTGKTRALDANLLDKEVKYEDVRGNQGVGIVIRCGNFYTTVKTKEGDVLQIPNEKITRDGWDPKYLEELKSKKFVKKGDDIYEKDGRWFCTVASWNSSPAKAAGAELETEDGILQDFTNFLMEPTEKAASGDSAVVFSSEEAQEIAAKAGVDLTKYDLGEFCRGLEVELEHSDLTAGDPSMTAKIVVAHLNEIPDYYTRLGKMESDAKDTKDALNWAGEREFRTYEGWKTACKKVNPSVRFEGSRDICEAVPGVGAWDGEKGILYNITKDADTAEKKIEAYGVKGMKSTQWRKVFKNQKEFENWLDKNEGDVEVYGTRTVDALSDFDRKQKERGKIYKIILPAGMGEPLYTSSAQAAIEMAKEYGKGTRVENLSETTDGGMDYDQYQRMKKEQLDDLKYAQEKGDKELEKRARATLAMIEQDWKESKDSAFKRFKDKLAVWKTKDSKQVGTYKGFNLYHVDTYSDGEKLYQGVDGDKIVRGKSLEEIKEKIDQSSRMNDKKACVRDAVRRLRYKGTKDGDVKKNKSEAFAAAKDYIDSNFTTDGGVGSGIKGHVTAKQIAAMKARKEAQSAQKPSAKKGGLSAKEIEGLKKNAVSTKTVFVQFDKRTNSFTQMRPGKGQDDKTGTLTWHQVNFYKSSDEKIKPLDLSHVNRAHGNGGILLRSKNEGKNVLGLVEIVKEKNKSGASDKTTDGGVGSGIKGHVTAKQIAAMKARK